MPDIENYNLAELAYDKKENESAEKTTQPFQCYFLGFRSRSFCRFGAVF
jgi:hypothetical protein